MSLLIPLFIHATQGLFVKLSQMSIDVDAVENGEWIGEAYGTPIPDLGDLCLRVRGIGNSDYRTLMAKLHDATPRHQKPGGKITRDASDAIFAKCLANTILMDWSGVEDDEGQPIPFSRDVALKILQTPRMEPFRHGVVWAASQVGEHRSADNEAAAGN